MFEQPIRATGAAWNWSSTNCFCIGNDTRPIADVNERWGVLGCGWVSIEMGNRGRFVSVSAVSPENLDWGGLRLVTSPILRCRKHILETTTMWDHNFIDWITIETDNCNFKANLSIITWQKNKDKKYWAPDRGRQNSWSPTRIFCNWIGTIRIPETGGVECWLGWSWVWQGAHVIGTHGEIRVGVYIV